MTSNTPAKAGNVEHAGDRVLSAFVEADSLSFATYTFGYTGGDDWNVKKSIPYEDDLTSWFFIYFGYNRVSRKAKVFVKF